MTLTEKPSLAIGTILYRPKPATLERFTAALQHGSPIYLFDNSPSPEWEQFARQHASKVRYFTVEKNVGIGPALRLMAATAYAEGHQNFLYFDQDTVFGADTLRFIDHVAGDIRNEVKATENCEVLSITFRDENAGNPRNAQTRSSRGGQYVNIVDFTISSGTLFFLPVLRSIGWHDDSYRVDGVDYRVCLKAKAAGARIVEVSGTPGLDHQVDQGDKQYRFLGRAFSARRYPMRRILDYCWSSLRLLAHSSRVSARSTLFLARALAIYIFVQVFVRVAHGQRAVTSKELS